MQPIDVILSGHPFLKGLAPQHTSVLVACASSARFKRDEFLFHEGGPANRVYVVQQGRVALEIAAPGRPPITVQTVGAGDVLGWSWMVPPYKWHFDARAVESTRAIALDADALRQKCAEDHDLGYVLLQRFSTVIVQRLQATRLQLLDVFSKST